MLSRVQTCIVSARFLFATASHRGKQVVSLVNEDDLDLGVLWPLVIPSRAGVGSPTLELKSQIQGPPAPSRQILVVTFRGSAPHAWKRPLPAGSETPRLLPIVQSKYTEET